MRKIVIALILLMVFELYANRKVIQRFSNHSERETIIENFEDNINYDTSSTIPSYSFGEYLVE